VVIALALGLVIAVVLTLALWRQATMAKDCRQETPLPKDVRLVAPGTDVPETVARFAGAWSGAWRPHGLAAIAFLFRHLVRGQSFVPPCQTLVVEEVLPNGYARLIFSYEASATLDIPLPEFLRVTGRVVNGALRFQLPLPFARPSFTYRVVGEALDGVIDLPDGVTTGVRLTRVTDLDHWGCGAGATESLSAPPMASPRDRLTAEELLKGIGPRPGPVHNAYFLPVGQSAPALHAFKGTVRVKATTVFKARHGCAGLAETLPEFTAAFFTHGEYLVPVVRDIMQPPGIILSPGRVWSEPDDQGMSRASFPFVLISPYSNETHNGLATFLYDDTRVSALRFQVVQETAAWAKYDGWGQASMTYTPGSVTNEETLRAQFAAELQQQTPIQPWSALQVSSEAQGPEHFDGEAAPEDVSASGLVVDGALYVHGCETRYGPYPYCRQMRHGVFSVTKSLGAAVALLRLAQKYGDQVFALKIKDYVPVTATHDGWERVTFADALNMATGIGDLAPQREPNQPFADENKPKMFQWVMAQTAKEKLDISFSYGKCAWGPGEVLRYNSTQTFVLAAAMDSFLKRQAGPQAHLWDMVVTEVFQPIGISQLPTMHTQEADGGHGIPHLASGLYPTIDDIAKLTPLLQNGGQYQGQQLLHAGKLAEALYKTDVMDLPNRQENRFGEGRYHLSFWSVPYRTANGCFFQIPYMAGYGGNLVVLLPNGISAFRVADGHNYDVDSMVLAGEALRPFPCLSGSREASPARQQLSGSEVRAELPGHTFYADPWNAFGVYDARLNMFVATDGTIYVTLDGGSDIGTWHNVSRWRIAPDGHFCSKGWNDRREGCATVYREGETFELHPIEGLGKMVFRRKPGNPEGY
jgi:hypothetical protein